MNVSALWRRRQQVAGTPGPMRRQRRSAVQEDVCPHLGRLADALQGHRDAPLAASAQVREEGQIARLRPGAPRERALVADGAQSRSPRQVLPAEEQGQPSIGETEIVDVHPSRPGGRVRELATESERRLDGDRTVGQPFRSTRAAGLLPGDPGEVAEVARGEEAGALRGLGAPEQVDRPGQRVVRRLPVAEPRPRQRSSAARRRAPSG